MNSIVPLGNAKNIGRSTLKKNGIQVKQSMAGRMRVRVQSLRRQERAAAWMRQRLLRVSGIDDVDTRPVTGSVIISFDAEKTHLRLLLGEIIEQIQHPVAFNVP